ncbi:MAG: hypothetical protein LBG21_06855 [Campylobacteraceae bacterium]|jgi:predicted DNA-binding protein|nr:hypothetical protein [Campylobacteraceae bacterium]
MPLSIRLPREMESRLLNLSKEAKVSQAQIIKEAVYAYIEDLEDYYSKRYSEIHKRTSSS